MKKLFLVSPNLYLPDEITLVGSSKFVLKSKKGKEIDLSNYIVRFNFAKTDGYEEFVGKKTSLMVMNNNQYLKLDNYTLEQKKKGKYLIIAPHKLKRHDYEFESFFFEKKINQFYLSLYFLKYIKIFINLIQILRKKNFSVGFCFILICLASGIKINVYGFDLEEDMSQRTHYYKSQSIGHVHDLSAEHIVLRKLKKHKLVKFHE